MLDNRQEIEAYVPHSGDMVLLDRVLSCDDTSIAIELDVGARLPGLKDGALPAYYLIEVMAQSIAAWSGIGRGQPAGSQPIGFLLGTRKFQCDRQSFELDSTVRIQSTQIFENEGLTQFTCSATLPAVGDTIVAQANVSVYSNPADV